MPDPDPPAPTPGLGPGIPEILKHYRLIRHLGSGGMGAVFEAVDRRDDTRVAVKLLHAHLAGDESFRERFEREAHVAALLRSPYTVHLLDYGISQGYYFLVMEFVDGESVAQRIHAEGRLDPRRALAIAADAARALEEAAARGVVHRDIKPDNILLGNDGSVKVADFGIARRVGGGGDLPVAGGFIGTTAYAAPEQSTDSVDGRADIYALGAALYCMLTGQPPFHGTALDIVRQHQEAPLPMGPLAGLPDQVVNIVRRCMEKEREDRYPDATALVGALERAQRSLTNQGGRISTNPGAATEVLSSPPRPLSAPIAETQVGSLSDVTALAPPARTPSNAPIDVRSDATAVVGAAASAAQVAAGQSSGGPPPASPPATTLATPPPPSNGGGLGKGLIVALAGVAAVIVAGAAVAFFALSGGDDGGTGSDDEPTSREETRTVRTTTARAVLTKEARNSPATSSANSTISLATSPATSTTSTTASATTSRSATSATSTATAARPPNTAAPPTAVPQQPTATAVPKGRIVAGDWTYEFVTISNSCGTGSAVGEVFTNVFTLDDANNDGYVVDGEGVTITDGQNGNTIGTYVFTYPAFTFQAGLVGGDFVVLRNQYSGDSFGTSLREDHYTVNGRPCVIAFQD